ncbi:hypothetical protein CLV47_12730 [Antricoccus suffuscus]|uniref:Uncharacterized protein n=1 Tax=Antricoccus suffuscus TaxID=1629062 RepID=A0A2T0Z6B0_9ACTN|nr:hypothetical protein [Antricoccus suffuscus]PRZ31694.1 hypothetical protein CLV47_12730 [Antricoccus suffuscus]
MTSPQDPNSGQYQGPPTSGQYPAQPQGGYQQGGYQQGGYQQGGYPAAPYQGAPAPAYGYQYPGGYGPVGPRPPQRPGVATGAGVCGIVLGVGSFGYAAALLIGAAAASDSGADNTKGFLAIAWICGILGVIASVSLFVGAIQMLSGNNGIVLRLGAVAAIIAIWVLAIWALSVQTGAGTVITVSAVVGSIMPAVVLGLSLSSSVSKWMLAKKAFKAAGYV